MLGIDGAVDAVRQRVGDAPVYVSVDIDVLDPAFAPGTGTPESGGLASRQLLRLLRNLNGLNLVGADVVEVSPAYDHAEITSVAAATVVFDLVALVVNGIEPNRSPSEHSASTELPASTGGRWPIVFSPVRLLNISGFHGGFQEFGVGQHRLGPTQDALQGLVQHARRDRAPRSAGPRIGEPVRPGDEGAGRGVQGAGLAQQDHAPSVSAIVQVERSNNVVLRARPWTMGMALQPVADAALAATGADFPPVDAHARRDPVHAVPGPAVSAQLSRWWPSSARRTRCWPGVRRACA